MLVFWTILLSIDLRLTTFSHVDEQRPFLATNYTVSMDVVYLGCKVDGCPCTEYDHVSDQQKKCGCCDHHRGFHDRRDVASPSSSRTIPSLTQPEGNCFRVSPFQLADGWNMFAITFLVCLSLLYQGVAFASGLENYWAERLETS